MAQDFGDDMGNALLNFVTRQTENYLRFGRGRERAFDWWQRHYKKEGNTPEQAKAMAEKQSSREQVVVPFGTSEEAAYYAQVCRENGTYAAAYTDKQGNGFLAFAKEDAKTVAGYAPQFKDVMARLDEQRITDALNHAEPVNKKTMDSLTELASYPDLPAEDVTVIPVTIRYKDAPEETYDVLFSEQDTENLNIDDSICFSGYSYKELTEMVGRETHEDFDVISVGAPYKVHATQVKTDAPEKTYENQFIHDLYNSPELCAAPRYVEQSFGCPSEEYEKEEGTLPHDFTTGKWRVHLIYPGERYDLDGCLTYELNAYSGAPAAAHRASYPLVEFYDTSQDAARFPGGQFVSRYYMTDLLEDDFIAVSLDTMLKNGNQFSLDGGIPAWTVEGDDLAKVNDFLKKSCMEFCGSLPGDEKDEDGYSLSGEAKDATASRNGLSRNQMGIEEKAAECKEAATVLANGNAL